MPQGAFVYPPNLKPSRAPLVIALLLAAAAAIGAVVYFVVLKRDDSGTTATAAARSETVAAGSETQAALAPAKPESQPDPEPEPEPEPQPEPEPEPQPEPEPELEPATEPRGTPSPRTSTDSRGAREPAPRTATDRRTTATTRGATKPSTARDTTGTPRDESEEPVEQPAPTKGDDGGCDEVACVLEKYARPCCAKYKPADTGFQPAAGDADSLTKPQIKAGVDRVRPRVIDCAQKHPAKGTVKVGVTVNGEGVVEDVSVKDAPDAALGECVASAMRKAKFAKTANGGAFTYPFVF